MTIVSGDLKIVTGLATQVTEVWARAARSRPITGGWLLENAGRAPVTNGRVSIDLQPGLCVLVAVIGGQPAESVELIVPSTSTAPLEACIRAAETAGGLERDALEELRSEVADWIARASSSASAAKTSASAAASSAGAAKTSETNAANSASSAKTSETNAKTSENNALASKNAAATSASNAKLSETNSAKSARQAANIANSTSWSGDKLTVNGKTSPSLTGPQGEVTRAQMTTAISEAIVALAPTGLKLVLAAPNDTVAAAADTAINAKGYSAVVVVPSTGNWFGTL